MGAARRLLIVDDEPAIAGMLDEFFRAEGYATSVAASAAAALELAGTCPPDLTLLDVGLPGMDGYELCRRLRESLACPIIFLTARVEDADQLDGFAAGADDYVTKPFSLAVLAGRVRAHLAREERSVPPGRPGARRFGALTVDYAGRRVEVDPPVPGPVPRAADLTRTEFDIVALLSKEPGRVFDRDAIYEQVWGWGATGDPSGVREHVRRARRKIAEAGFEGECIETVWGVGYRWAAS